MASGYVRQSASQIASGQGVNSSPVNNEFTALAAAFSGTSGHDHSGGTGLGPGLGASAFGGLTSASLGFAAANGSNSFNVVTLTGTANQITITNGAGSGGNPVFSIATGYVGQASITTLGTIATGVWAGTTILGAHGGTGAANSGVLTYGASNLTFTTGGTTTLTLPTSGTLLSSTNNLSDVSSASTAINNIVPSQTGNSAKFLTTNGSTVSWANVSGASGGTVTSVTATGDGTVLSSTPSSAVTSSGTLTLALANAAGGTVLGNSSGTSAAPSYTATPVHGINTSVAGTLGLANGSASGATITVKNLGCTSAYNFNLPTTAGTSGQVLTSQGGSSTSMTWAANTAGTVTSVTFTGDGTVLSSTPSSAVTASGTVTAALATATAKTLLGNATASTAAPTYTTAPVVSGQMTAASFKASGTSGVIGTTTNDSAAAGSVGELLSGSAADNSIAMVTATPKTVTSVSLTAGDWEVSGTIIFTPDASTSPTQILGCVGTTTNSIAVGTPQQFDFNATFAQALNVIQSTPTVRFSLASTTTVFLVAQAGFSGNLNTGGTIRARRVR